MSDLERFVLAQEDSYAGYIQALTEMEEGRKVGHLIWYIFPQLQGLGRSDMCREYGVRGLGEAKALMANQTFASHLREISRALLDLDGSDPVAVLGKIDARKVRSCMTLFALADEDEPVIRDVLRKYYGDIPDERTLELLGVAWPW